MTFDRSMVDANQCEFVLAMPDEEKQSNALGEMGPKGLCATQLAWTLCSNECPGMHGACQAAVQNWKLPFS